MAMSHSRFCGIYNGLTALAKKVYEAVPISAPWGLSEVHAELVRTGSDPGKAIVEGCLKSLVSSGLVKERALTFIRIPVREKIEHVKKDEEPMATQQPAAPEGATDRLSGLASRASKIATMMRQFADDLELAAVEIDDGIGKDRADLEKLRHLRDVLNSLK